MVTRVQEVISARSALELVRFVLEESEAQGLAVSVAVCGPELQLIALIRGDGAPPHSLETARRKAQTAASRGQASGTLEPGLALNLALASGNALSNLRGGLPIFVGSVCVGGIGVGGASADQDVAFANAALAALKN